MLFQDLFDIVYSYELLGHAVSVAVKDGCNICKDIEQIGGIEVIARNNFYAVLVRVLALTLDAHAA